MTNTTKYSKYSHDSPIPYEYGNYLCSPYLDLSDNIV